jgi:hypothetical protein
MKYYAEQIYGREIIVNQYGDNGKVLRWSFGPEIASIAHRADYKYGGMFVPHDAVNRLLQAGGRSAIDQLFEFGIKSRSVAATAQQKQIDLARVTLEKTWADPVMCKEGLKCLRKYQFKFDENKGSYSREPDHDTGGYSHGCDAFEIIGQVWKSSVVSSEEQKPRFLEDLTAKDVFFPEFTAKLEDDRI